MTADVAFFDALERLRAPLKRRVGKARADAPTERVVQREIVKALRKMGVFVVHVPNGSHLAGDAQARMHQSSALVADGMTPGFSDLMCINRGGMIAFAIPGVCVAKGRARTLKSGRSYTPAKTANYAARVAQIGKLAMGDAPMIEGPLSLSLVVHLPIPASWSRAKREGALKGTVWPVSRPDVDNYAKNVLDALNGVVWADDSAVVSMTCTKVYSDDPRAVVRVVPV